MFHCNSICMHACMQLGESWNTLCSILQLKEVILSILGSGTKFWGQEQYFWNKFPGRVQGIFLSTTLCFIVFSLFPHPAISLGRLQQCPVINEFTVVFQVPTSKNVRTKLLCSVIHLHRHFTLISASFLYKCQINKCYYSVHCHSMQIYRLVTTTMS